MDFIYYDLDENKKKIHPKISKGLIAVMFGTFALRSLAGFLNDTVVLWIMIPPLIIETLFALFLVVKLILYTPTLEETYYENPYGKNIEEKK